MSSADILSSALAALIIARTMPNFHNLPYELLEDVTRMSGRAATSALAQTSKWLHYLVIPILYKRHIKDGLCSALFWAAKVGELGTLKYLLHYGADLNAIGSVEPDEMAWGRAVHYAARGGHDEVVAWLLEHGAKLNVPSGGLCACTDHQGRRGRWYPLHLAMCSDWYSTVHLLIQNGAGELPLSTTYWEAPALWPIHSAAACGLTSVLRLLVSRGHIHDVNVTDRDNNTALHYAAQNLHEDQSTIRELARMGANLNYRGHGGSTPLLVACRAGNWTNALALIELGADVNAGDGDNLDVFPLHVCAGQFQSPGLRRDPQYFPVRRDEWYAERMRVLLALIERGAIGDAVTSGMVEYEMWRPIMWNGFTPLMLAATSGWYEGVEILLGAGAAVNRTNVRGQTALHLYVLHCRDGDGPLVAQWGLVFSAFMMLFLDYGARLDIPDVYRGTALDHLLDWPYRSDKRSWDEPNSFLAILLDLATEQHISAPGLRQACRRALISRSPASLRQLMQFGIRHSLDFDFWYHEPMIRHIFPTKHSRFMAMHLEV